VGGAATAGAGGSNAGSAGEAGSGGEAGASGTGGTSPDAGSPDEPDASLGPDCWIVTLNDTTHISSNNCLGIYGWNDVEQEGSTVVSSYENGQVCFDGTIGTTGWGAVYNLTLADDDAWDGATQGVGGFQFAMTGATLPSSLQIKYTQEGAGDFCRAFTPGPAVQVPFSSAHPSCSTDPEAATPDASELTYIRLVFLPKASSYDVDFCMQIRAIP
jgi:hypothetical protein